MRRWVVISITKNDLTFPKIINEKETQGVFVSYDYYCCYVSRMLVRAGGNVLALKQAQLITMDIYDFQT